MSLNFLNQTKTSITAKRNYRGLASLKKAIAGVKTFVSSPVAVMA